MVLAFHRVIAKEKAASSGLHPSLYITPGSFEKLLLDLKKMGRFTDLFTLIESNARGPLFSVTFDDGWQDVYENALPILKRHGIPFTIFVSTSLVDTGTMNWTEEIAAQYAKKSIGNPEKAKEALGCLLPEKGKTPLQLFNVIESLKYIPDKVRQARILSFYDILGVTGPIKGEMLSWDELKKLADEGAVIGSHTHSHTILKGAKREKISEELTLSRQFIKRRVGTNTDIFCYPNSLYDLSNEEVLKADGYKYAFITDDKRVPSEPSPYFIPRFIVYEDIIPILYSRFITEKK